jgi:hypothetical protein
MRIVSPTTVHRGTLGGRLALAGRTLPAHGRYLSSSTRRWQDPKPEATAKANGDATVESTPPPPAGKAEKTNGKETNAEQAKEKRKEEKTELEKLKEERDDLMVRSCFHEIRMGGIVLTVVILYVYSHDYDTSKRTL